MQKSALPLLSLLLICNTSCADDTQDTDQKPGPIEVSFDFSMPQKDMGQAPKDMNTSSADLAQRQDLAQAIDMAASKDEGSTQDLDQASPIDMPPANSCSPGVLWAPSTPAFKNITVAAGLETINAAGTRVSVADINADDWPDLIVRRASNTATEHSFNPPGRKHVWILKNLGDGSFEEITRQTNLLDRRDGKDDQEGLGRPAEIFAFADIDNDGDLDAFTAFSNSDANLLNPESAEVMLNQGDGTFVLGPKDDNAIRVSQGAFTRGGASFVDLDRDGKIDLWLGTGGPGQDLLYKGDGTGAFTNETASHGLLTKPWSLLSDLNAALAHTNSWGVNACDLNNDGQPELLSASYGRAPNHLWQAQTQGLSLSYLNRSIASGYAFDDRQNWRDNASARCHCTLNPGDPECTGVPAPTRIRCSTQQDVFRWRHQFDRNVFRLGGNSGTTVCADLNNDGWLDLLTSEIVHWDVGENSDPSEVLYNQKTPDVTFTRPGNSVTGLTRTQEVTAWNDGDITSAAFDFDNDGRLDIYIGSNSYPGTRGLLFHQKPDGTFEPVPLNSGIDHKSSHGIGIADIDRDGDLDLIAGHSRGRCSSGSHCYPKDHIRLFENIVGNKNQWIQLKLEGITGTNRSAIGARITIEAGGLTQTKQIDGGHGHYGIQHEQVAHFGLGSECEANVTITWPDQSLTTQTLTLKSGARYHIVQGKDAVEISP